jgi:IMP dehydrogenase
VTVSASKFKVLERAYGFDEVALVPGNVTINPDQVNIKFPFCGFNFDIPFLASAMDGVTDPRFAVAFGKMGGLAVLNLEGVQCRYDDPDAVLAEIAATPQAEVTALMQKVYSAPIKPNLIGERIQFIKKAGIVCACSIAPPSVKKLAPLTKEAGLDILVIAATVTTARHKSKSIKGVVLSEIKKELKMPIVVGNTVSYTAAMELMREGIDGLLVGVGPGAACTTREVLGVGVPQVTATIDSAAARDEYFNISGRYVPIITDGGMRTGGDVCKAFAAGADAVMIGSPFAGTQEAPGRGFHWGMAHPHAALPRGTRIKVGQNTTLQQLMLGPTSRTDGTQNLVGALRTCMGVCSASNIKEMHRTRMVIAPSIKSEGKIFQIAQCANG